MPGSGFCSAGEHLSDWEKNISSFLSDPGRGPLTDAVITAAHPDDEVIGAGGLFRRFSRLHFVHTTDGSPRNMSDALAAGYNSRQGYAAARRRELLNALQLAEIPLSRCFEAGFADQEASLNMAQLIRVLFFIFRKLRPVMIFTPAYEGGHPDHDATALAVHAASALLRRHNLYLPLLIEYALYHKGPEGIKVSEFLQVEGAGKTESFFLNPEERSQKNKMMRCFRTQSAVLTAFQTEVERFRQAPSYDFCSPPHAGRLYYEHFDWGMTGAGWRRLATEALDRFRIRGRI